MKRRWAILFWTSLAALSGMSWTAARFGVALWSMMNVALVGLIAASAIAFVAMQRGTRAKWPAAAALVCSAPMTLQMVSVGADVRILVDYYGASIILLFWGTIATAVIAIWILVAPLAALPPEPIAEARVVD